MAFAAVIALLVQLVDPQFESWYLKVGVKVPNDSDYTTFLATVSGIGGVFIGLYYAGVSAIGSAIYATVPNNIRDLLAEERYGNTYMRFLSFLTVLSLTFIAMRLMGLPRNHLVIPLVALGVAIGIIAFVELGRRAFYLFDPTKLSFHIFERLGHWLRMVKVGGLRWSNESFQNYAHRNARATIETLQTLTDITAAARHLRGKPFIELSEQLLQFLSLYELSKASIPSDSLWYEQQYKHRDWYVTEYSQVSVAHATGTFLQPITVTNKEWVETSVLPIVNDCIITNLQDKKYGEVLGLFKHISAYIGTLGRVGAIQRAFETMSDIFDHVLDQIANPDCDGTGTDKTLEKIAVVEGMATFSISMALGYREHLESINKEYIEKKIARINWHNTSSMYNQGIPAYCLPRLEWLRKRLAFEYEVEGIYVTPQWYQSELICRDVVERLTKNANALVDKGTALFKKINSTVFGEKHPWLAAAFMSREWEYWHKVEDQLHIWVESISNLAVDRRIAGSRWMELDGDQLTSHIKHAKSKLVSAMSHHSLELDFRTRPANLPDYAGQFLHITGEVTFDSVMNNDLGLLETVFEPYLLGCICKFESLLPTGENFDWQERQDAKVAAAPLLDAMDISGYARLLSDYHGNDKLWQRVKDAWSKYLTSTPHRLSTKSLAAALSITDTAFEIPHRGVHRTNWNRRIHSELKNVPRHEEYHDDAIVPNTLIDHNSPIVRVFAKGGYSCPFDGIDAFVELYLCKISNIPSSSFGSRRLHLQDSIDRETQRKKKDEGDIE